MPLYKPAKCFSPCFIPLHPTTNRKRNKSKKKTIARMENSQKQTTTTTATTKSQPSRVVIFPTPGMGHLIPLVEFAKRLVQYHNLTVTFIIPTDGSPPKAQKSVLDVLPASIDYVFLPSVNFDDVPQGARIETLISLTIVRSLSFLRQELKSLLSRANKLVSLVVDLFGTDAIDVAKEFNLSPYIFYPSTAMALSLFLHLPKLDQSVSCEYRDLPEPVRIPGAVPIPGKELLDPVQDRQNDAYKWVLHHTKRYGLAEGIIVNSFKELEPGPISFLQEKEPGRPPVYPVGPLVNMEASSKADGSGCMKWLEDQPHGSVLFVSFGSGGTLSSEQINELALGLEASEQRFLWVVRRPNDKVANATYFSVHSSDDSFDFLPNGFLERTKGRGLVVPSWAPQAQILSHGSTGGFLTHCGWNSTLESVVNGVPLVAWPLYAEQKMNAFMLTQDIGVALRPKPKESGIVCKEEIAKVVKALMEGEEGKRIRNQMKDLKDAAARVLSENGSSTKALSEVVAKWENQCVH
ncbi:hydroquinone glucosyltransferase [Ziziphus jujuba]|uniref:Glycosyltransferase n=1 Tax=Ziziphus jujuba TaxID=326968 RepID=A0A6P4ATH1_ZIZJJ|nr:hydroquinone glucosyltransferase [Ziziphus jujuba]